MVMTTDQLRWRQKTYFRGVGPARPILACAQRCTELNVSAAGDIVVFSNFSVEAWTENILQYLFSSVDGKHLMRFQSENAIFGFFQGSADEIQINCKSVFHHKWRPHHQ